MAETCIEFIAGEDYVSYSSDDKVEMRYMVALFGHKDVEVILNEDDFIMLHVPKSWYRRPKPPVTRTLTDEQKQAAKERLSKARKAKNG